MSTLAEQTDERFMRIALGEANKAAMLGEVPIGAVVASGSGTIIGRGHNLTERLCDVTAHAEIQAITAAASARPTRKEATAPTHSARHSTRGRRSYRACLPTNAAPSCKIFSETGVRGCFITKVKS